MDDIHQLKAAVLKQVHREGHLQMEVAEEQVAVEFQKRQAQMLREKKHLRQTQMHELSQAFQIEQQKLRHKERQSTLVAKQEVLSELFTAAKKSMEMWSEAEEVAFLQSVLKKYSQQDVAVILGELTSRKLGQSVREQLIYQFPQVHFSEEIIPYQAGFILSHGGVDDTYLYNDLIASVQKSESSQLATTIFTES